MERSRLGYGDFLRCLAAFAVVVLHCAGATLAADDPGSTRFFVLNLLDGASRWAVPVFVMLSGMFLLDPDRPMPPRKWLGHLVKVAVPLLFWGFFYAFYDTRGAHLGLEWCLEALISMVKGQLHYHLWYLPMLLGLYLLLPPLRALVRGASRRVLWYCVGLWAAAAVVMPTLYSLLPDALSRPWFRLLRLDAVVSYAGYLLLGWLLRTCQVKPQREATLYALGALGLAVTVAGTQMLSQQAGALRDTLYGNLTPNICLAAAAIFLLCQRLELGKAPLWSRLAPCTFGAYLIHPMLIHVTHFFGLPRPSWNVAWAIPAQALLTYAAALAAAWCVRQIPRVGKHLC